jgi:hypothetical protein
MENITRSREYGVFDQTKLFTCNILYPHNLKIALANGFLYIQMFDKQTDDQIKQRSNISDPSDRMS